MTTATATRRPVITARCEECGREFPSTELGKLKVGSLVLMPRCPFCGSTELTKAR
jgi:DNA-directed RNA polymerase subunit RPC12/RpoP